MLIIGIILIVVGTTLMAYGVIGLSSCKKDKKPRNKVHFYLVKTSFMRFELFLGYPTETFSSRGVWWTGDRVYVDNLKDYGINLSDYNNLKYNKPVEVFLNLED